MGLFKRIRKVVKRAAPALLGGHVVTAAAARFKPGVVGLKSSRAIATVAKTQGIMAAAGGAMMGGAALTAPTKPAVAPAAVNPQDSSLGILLMLMFLSLMSRR